MGMNFTIPVHEAFDACKEDKTLGCPLCRLYQKLEEDELDLILGASMMEPDIRIKTNEEGFCRTHYDMMFVRKNRLGMALTLESHLAELAHDLRDEGQGNRPIKRIGKLNDSCYVCHRVSENFEHMTDTVVYLWQKEEDFPKALAAQPYFCLPHYKKLLEYGQRRLSKKGQAEFAKVLSDIEGAYLKKLQNDVSWFCKKFDYRYEEEPWYDSKDAVERAFKFLRGDLHKKV